MAESDIEQLAAAAMGEEQTDRFREWAGRPRMMLAIAFTDIVASTALAVRVGDLRMGEIRRAHFLCSGDLIRLQEGFEIKTIGDSAMAAFATAEAALAYVRALQQNPGHLELLGRVRGGIHVGPLDIEKADAFGTTVNFAARVVHAVAGPDIGVSEAALDGLAAYFGKERIVREWCDMRQVEMKGFGLHPVYFCRPAAPGSRPGRRGGFRLAPLRAGPAVASDPGPDETVPKNLEDYDFVGYGEAVFDERAAGQDRPILAQVHFIPKLFVAGEGGSQVNFGVRHFAVHVSKEGSGDLVPSEELRAATTSPRVGLVIPRGREADGDSVTIAVEAEAGKPLGSRAIPPIGDDNLLSHLATAGPDVAADQVEVELQVALRPEGLIFPDETGRELSRRTQRNIERIIGVLAHKGEEITERRMIRRRLELRRRGRDG